MKSVRLTLIFSLLWALCACSGDDSSIDSRNGERVPIRLTASNVGVNTRATGNLQDTQMAEGETVYVWADENGGSSNYLKAWTLTATTTADPSNAGYYQLTGSDQYYPSGTNYGMDIYAVHGNFAETQTEGTTERPTTLTHTAMTDQSTAANYQKSDLLYAANANVAYGTTPIPLLFSHRLSRLVIRLVKDSKSKRFDDETDLEGSTLTISGTIYHVGTFTLATQAFANTTTTAAITVSKNEDLKFYVGGSEATTQYCAILPPQTLTNALITITTGAGITASGTFSREMTAGNAYILNVTLTDPGLIVDKNKYTEQW